MSVLTFIVLVLLIVKLFIPIKTDTRERLKLARVELGITCTILILETIVLVESIIAGNVWIFSALIILCQVVALVLNVINIRIYKDQLKFEDTVKSHKNRLNDQVIV